MVKGLTMRPKLAQARSVLIEALERGASRTLAAELAGIHRAQLYRWLAKGAEAPGGEYGRFAQDVIRAEAQAVASAVDVVIRAAVEDRDWRAAAWFLERRDPAFAKHGH